MDKRIRPDTPRKPKRDSPRPDGEPEAKRPRKENEHGKEEEYRILPDRQNSQLDKRMEVKPSE